MLLKYGPHKSKVVRSNCMLTNSCARLSVLATLADKEVLAMLGCFVMHINCKAAAFGQINKAQQAARLDCLSCSSTIAAQ